MKPIRIESLDYLRGVMALSVMIYHYSVWAGVGLENSSILSKLGIYAVSIFYILSGLSLSIVYRNRINSPIEMGQFFIRRFFRIAPLFWISVLSVLMLKYFGSMFKGVQFQIDIYIIFLNISLLFGFLQPDAYLSTRAWSIGNEMVFYAIFPIIILFSSRFSWIFPVTLLISIILGATFAVFWLDPLRSLVDQWIRYINPFNNIFLFLGGVAIGTYSRPARTLMGGGVAIIAFFVFWLYPVGGDRIHLVAGSGRICLSLACFAFVWATYVTSVQFKGAISRALSFFGESCYSIYLMHPLVALPVVFIASRVGFSLVGAYCVATVLTLFVSWATFKHIEAPMMRMGSKVAYSLHKRQVEPA